MLNNMWISKKNAMDLKCNNVQLDYNFAIRGLEFSLIFFPRTLSFMPGDCKF